MKVTIKHSADFRDTLRLMADLAYRHTDDQAILDRLKWSPERLYHYLQSLYQTEEGEVLQSPDRTAELMRGDCDDQAIFAAAYFLARGWQTNRIFYILSGRAEITHVLLATGRRGNNRFQSEFWFDMLPERRWGDEYIYPIMQIFSLRELL